MNTHPPHPGLVPTLKTCSKAMAAGACLLASVVLGGWALDYETLRSLPPMWSHMMPNTAVCLLALAVALWLQEEEGRANRVAIACAWGVAAVGMLTLGEYAFGWELGIDRALFTAAVSQVQVAHPGRMSVNTASCFVLLGAALTRLDSETVRGHRPAQLLALAPATVAMLALVGYAYGAQQLTGIAGHARMAFPTALSVLLLSAGILFARPDRGMMAVIVSDSSGGLLARRFLPTAIGVLIGLGWLRIAGQRAGYFGTEFGTALMVSINVCFFAALIWRSAVSINRTDAGRREAEDALRKTRDELEVRVQSRTADLERQNNEVLLVASSLATFADQIVAATTELATTALQTATEVSETTTTVEEVKHAAQVSSMKAQVVSDQAQKAAQASQSGKRAVRQTIEGMTGIRQQMTAVAESILNLSAQSQAIGGIISTVEDLAAQSKLLAVNASIEASKAGEEGRGFTVVAQEVRSLSEQSRRATTQVRGILNDIQKATSSAVLATEQASKTVEAGVRQSTAASESIAALGESVAESVQAAAQIAATSQQQFVGMDQVAAAMESIKLASTQAVTSTRQAEDAAQRLRDLGMKLRQLAERPPAVNVART